VQVYQRGTVIHSTLWEQTTIESEGAALVWQTSR
jgi:hypothetical protein